MTPTVSLLSLLALLLSATALEFTPSGKYAPSIVKCPRGDDAVTIRPATCLSEPEKAFRAKRAPNVINAMEKYLKRVNVPGFDVDEYICKLRDCPEKAPVISLSISGGGARSENFGFGVYDALDDRNPQAVKAKTGGLTQALTYIAGGSGGAVGTAVLTLNGGRSIRSQLPVVLGPPGFGPYDEIIAKNATGLPISVADVFAISTGYGLTGQNQKPDPLAVVFSGIAESKGILEGTTPAPVIMIAEIEPGVSPSYKTKVGTVSFPLFNKPSVTLYELNAWEFGSWTGRAKAFMPLKFSGTTMEGGKPANANKCVVGFDTAAFVVGTATAALSQWYVAAASFWTVGKFGKRAYVQPDLPERAIEAEPVLEKRRKSSDPFAKYHPVTPPRTPFPQNEAYLEALLNSDTLGAAADSVGPVTPEVLQLPLLKTIYGLWPNPFRGYKGSARSLQQQKNLQLLDGTVNGQNTPTTLLARPERASDFIIVADAGGAELSSNWMNLTGLQISENYARGNGIPFPRIPDSRTALNKFYTQEPVFFGCNEPAAPLLLFIAQARRRPLKGAQLNNQIPYSAFGNISFISGFNLTARQQTLLLNDVLASVSQVNDRLRPGWTDCLACGSVWKSLERLGLPKPAKCEQCMKDFCWQGDKDTRSPPFIQPKLKLQPGLSAAEWNRTIFYGSGNVGPYTL